MAQDLEPALRRYIQYARSLPRLSREEEHSLACRVRRDADRAAAERLILANLRYVVAIAVSYRRYPVKMADLISEGSIGLMTAVTRFDPDKGTRFVTYASYWIRAYILEAVLRGWSLVGGGAGVFRSKVFFRLRRERAKMSSQLHDEAANHDALAAQLGVTRERLTEMLQRLDARDVSLDMPLFDDGAASAVEALEDPNALQDERFERAHRAQLLDHRVRDAVGSLDPRERFIIEQRILADDELSLAEIGRRLGVSRERARQLESRAREKLKRSLRDLEAPLAA
ncbi:MAG: RNA polymerase factor sigma-32 [Myxococcales bacterium]|nr:RNA polymerase factor sigma-32 [Myxococcales bacterium]